MVGAVKQVRYGERKGMKRVDRDEYGTVSRNPIAILSWATDKANIGGICRLAEAYLVERLFCLDTPGFAAAVGTHKWQPTSATRDLHAVVETMRQGGFPIVALEITDVSVDLREARLPSPMCLLVGNEGTGVPTKALDRADMAITIPQFGMVGSLNVTMATAITLYEWSRQYDPRTVWRAA